MNLSTNAFAKRLNNAVAAGTGTTNSASLDLQDWESGLLIFAFGAITATSVVTIHAEGSNDDSAWVDLVGTEMTVADDDDNQIAILDIGNVTGYRYIRGVVIIATANAVIDGIIGLGYEGNGPSTHDATTVVGFEYHNNPATGTP